MIIYDIRLISDMIMYDIRLISDKIRQGSVIDLTIRFLALGGCNEWQARKALLLRSSYGRLSRVTNFNGNQPMDPRLIDEIKKIQCR